MSRPRHSSPDRSNRAGSTGRPVRSDHGTLRIIGGRFRGRRLAFTGDPRTRPMKERVREATFNLIGPAIRDKHAIDLFAGTGALGLESVSRGAARATMIERHFPTARVIRQNVTTLSLGGVATVITADTFVWARRLPDLGTEPWAVFCSPPYRLYDEKREDMLALVATFLAKAPPTSIVVVEADVRFDTSCLPQSHAWDIRPYPPAVVAIHRGAVR